MLKFFKKMLFRNDYASEAAQSVEITATKIPPIVLPVQDEFLSPTLLNQFKQFEVVTLKKGTILYHGSREKSIFTEFNVNSRSLNGSRKWTTEDKIYAINYAFCDRHTNLGKPLLWKLKLTEDIKCLHGSQFKLIPFSPWSEDAFPSKLPDNYSKYAEELLGEQKSQILLDHFEENMYTEILIANHTNVIEIIDVFELPDNKDKAINFAKNMKKKQLTNYCLHFS
ncbi:hypothetical protein [Photobacterium kishitanii]|uniref:hypothetical protein n=1 Tax=Photobacterium kishitanii TaxID=318456 RepID=UPI0005D331FB|nr:hypothetical protein [Photobacterium kishitanii]KJG66161.1 hypothetical protein UA41_21175 [Photobacterium kishitanii]